jgi:DNA gyrase inhibitor GyrI
MGGIRVRIASLPPMRVASVRAIGREPERSAWEKLRSWGEPRGLLDDPDKHPVFGFNNPNPSPGQTEYGYEFWISVDAGETGAEGEIEIKEFPGGLYAVTTCKLLDDPHGTVPEVWQDLWKWVQASPYNWRRDQEFEKSLNPGRLENEIVLELYLPIQPPAESASEDTEDA